MQSRLTKADRMYAWHLWFAWRPVRCTDRRVVWLRAVWRRSWRTLAGWHHVYIDSTASPEGK